MAKPMYMTDDVRRQIMEMFVEKLKGAKMSDGKVTVSQEFVWSDDDDRVSVQFTPSAWCKMITLVQDFETEVAWHATVDRVEPKVFVVDNIFVYPQEVSGTTVNTDQEGYDKWTLQFDNDTFNRLRVQGHSHVNMGTSPSTVDLTHQAKIVNMLTEKDFYIFMIWNKKLEHTIKVYDATTNTLYEDADVDVSIVGQEFDREEFLKDARAKVVRKTYAGTGYQAGSYGGKGYGYQGGSGYTPPKTPSLPSAQNAASKSAQQSAEDFLAGVRDYDEFVYGRHI